MGTPGGGTKGNFKGGVVGNCGRGRGDRGGGDVGSSSKAFQEAVMREHSR